jgi:glc operon protein GlcG
MDNQKLDRLVTKMFAEIERLIPLYMQNAEDKNIANGNVAACVIADDGTVLGRMFGKNKPRLRQSYKVTEYVRDLLVHIQRTDKNTNRQG